MVGHIPLEDIILVRVQVWQFGTVVENCQKEANNFASGLDENSGAMFLKLQKQASW
jgi:hypothetical protein